MIYDTYRLPDGIISCPSLSRITSGAVFNPAPFSNGGVTVANHGAGWATKCVVSTFLHLKPCQRVPISGVRKGSGSAKGFGWFLLVLPRWRRCNWRAISWSRWAVGPLRLRPHRPQGLRPRQLVLDTDSALSSIFCCIGRMPSSLSWPTCESCIPAIMYSSALLAKILAA